MMTKSTNIDWIEKLMSLFNGIITEEEQAKGLEHVKKRKTAEFLVSSGVASIRIYDEKRKPVKANVKFPKFIDEDWKHLASKYSEGSSIMAKLLAGELSKEAEDISEQENIPLVPTDPASIEINAADEPLGRDALGVLYVLLQDSLEKDPFNLFLLRGVTRENLLYKLREFRTQRIGISKAKRLENEQKLIIKKQHQGSLKKFWSTNPEIFELSYQIKADELPAALLRRMDALPLGEKHFEIELAFEGLYAHVARRAQAFGLGL